MSPDGNVHEARHDDAAAPPGADLGFELPPPARLTRTRAIALGVGAAVLLGGAFAAGYMPRRQARAALEEATATSSHASARVEVIAPVVASSDRALSLPGSVKPLEETIIYSRANGYLHKWLVDIGDKVKEGQLLAEIETPELDQELVQARAQLAQTEAGVVQAIANRDFAKADSTRYKALAPSGVASQQEVEQKAAQAQVTEANVTVAQAAVSAARANIERLEKLKSFARVTAPFDGTITERAVDRGALVTPGSSTPLFKIASVDPARVFVQVPQDVAPSLRADLTAKITVREYPGRVFEGKVTRTAGALDPASRTMTTEVRVPNLDGALIAGMYAEVSLNLPSPHRVLEIPATAVMNDSKGLRVVVVGDDDKVRLVPVVVERDTGKTVQISSGLSGDERIVKLASAGLTDGSSVEVIK